jgi:hypothetical protein
MTFDQEAMCAYPFSIFRNQIHFINQVALKYGTGDSNLRKNIGKGVDFFLG